MGYRLLADAAMVAHAAFLAFVVFGGFAAWRWPALIVPHLLCAAYGLGIIVIGWDCPLTWVEDWARRRAGQAGLTEGFIDTYLTGVVYPERYLVHVRVAAGAVVAASWLGWYLLLRRRRAG
ncbi:DUF2784 domain-containing protein [Allonocardiopsis opalescens]|uniref:DUF2784 domain-containing protein n=1 Tax=Allonocardiopsis opalescens TaxID=1144618 RepID=UPI000D04EB6E|nr:DUF2784 domain-containing protein [Allonocardiopsis opalescens]